jgi:hypothetical protein
MQVRITRAGRALALAGLFLSPALVPAAPARAQAPEPAAFLAVSGEVDVNSHYVWRGISLSRGAVVNPSLTFAHGDWSLNAWTNLDRDLHQARALNEVDWTLGWSRTVLGFEIAPSVLYYTYPTSDVPNTGELQLELGRTLHGPLSAFTRQSVEFLEVRGAAWSAVGLACELPEWKHVTASGNVTYGRGWWKFASAYADPALEGLNLASAGVSATVAPPGTGFTIRPHLDWYGVGNRRVRGSLTGSTPWVVGVAVGGAF